MRTETLPMCLRFVFGLSLVLGPAVEAAEPAGARGGQRVRDDVFLQEVGRQVVTAEPLTAVALHGSEVFIGSGKGVMRLVGGTLVEDAAMRAPVRRLVSAGGDLWAVTALGLRRLDTTGWKAVGDEAVSDVCEHRGAIVTAAGRKLRRVRGDVLEPIGDVEAKFDITRLVPHQGSLYLHGAGRLTTYAFGTFGGKDAYDFPADQTWDWGALPSPVTRSWYPPQ